MIRWNALWLYKNHCCENTVSILPQSCAAVLAALQASERAVQWSQVLLKSLADLRRGLRSFKIWPFYKSNLVASWMHLHNCRFFQEHLRMLLQSLRVLCLAPAGSGSIWINLEAVVRSPGVSGRIAWGFWPELRLADVRWDENEMMSVYFRVWWIYTPWCTFHLCYPCICIHPLSLLTDKLGGRNQVTLVRHLQTEIEWIQLYTLRPWLCSFSDELGDQDRVNSEMLEGCAMDSETLFIG